MQKLSSLLRDAPPVVDRVEGLSLTDIFEEEPVPLDVFVGDKKFLHNPPLSDEQFQAVRHAERIYFEPLYPVMAEGFGHYWDPIRMVNTLTLLWGKGCLVGTEELYDAHTGAWRPIESLSEPGMVAGRINPTGGATESFEASPSFVRGTGPCFKVTTRRGQEMSVYAGHQFYTPSGWARLQDLEIGQKILSVSEVPEPSVVKPLPEHEVELVGWWLGDGIMPADSSKGSVVCLFATPEVQALAAYELAVRKTGAVPVAKQHSEKACVYVGSRVQRLPSRTTQASRREQIGAKKGRPRNPLSVLVDRFELTGKTCYSKRVPPEFFFLPTEQIALFMSRLWGTDGHVYAPDNPLEAAEVSYTTVSEGLALDIQRLLLRLGVAAYKTRKNTSWTYKGIRHTSEAWVVRVRKGSDLVRFCEQVVLLDKRANQQKIIERYALKTSWSATSWDVVQSVEPLGDLPYWDIHVEDANNYVAGAGLLNHNSGKDHICRITSLRVAYLLLCLRSPQRYFEMPEQDTIHLLNVATSAGQASEAFFTPMVRAVKRGWFADKCEPKQNAITWDKHVQALSGHSDAESQEGLNLILGIADEVDAFKTGLKPGSTVASSHIDTILSMIHSSASTRFPLTFKEMRISYSRYVGSAIMRLQESALADIARNGENSKHYVSGPLCTWEVNPKFRDVAMVEVPGIDRPVPVVYEQDFLDDPVSAKTKYMCQPSRALDVYFKNEIAVRACAVHRDPVKISYKIVQSRGAGEVWEPVYAFDPGFLPIRGARYVIHCDMAIRGDRAGIAMSHVERWEDVEVVATNQDGYETTKTEQRPVVKVDFVVVFEADVKATPPREIQIRWARQLAVQLRQRGFNIQMVSYDGFESADSRQILQAQGMDSDRVSTDRDVGIWRNLRDLMYEGRITFPDHSILLTEVLSLANLGNGKVDHPPLGSKDEADALACSVYGAVLLGGAEDDEGEVAEASDAEFAVLQPYDMPLGLTASMGWSR